MSSEHDDQVALFEYAALRANQDDAWALLYAVPNGGARHPIVGAKLKAEGVKAGYPDIGLDVPRGPYHGARVEMKHGRNKPTDRQQWWIDQLHRQGYFVAVCYGFDDAKDTLEWYLGLDHADA